MDYFDVGRAREYLEETPLDIASMDEMDLEKIIKPSMNDWQLRRNFWSLVEKCRRGERESFGPFDVYKDVMTKPSFFNFLKNHHRKAWVMKPFTDLNELIDDTFRLALTKLHRILTNLDTDDQKTLASVLNAAKFLADRSIGAVTQTTIQHNKNVNIDANRALKEGASPTELESRFKSLGQEKDITPKPIEIEGKNEG